MILKNGASYEQTNDKKTMDGLAKKSMEKGTREMKNFDIELFVKDLDKQFNDMQDKAIAGSENVATASWVIKNQTKEIEYWKQMFEKAMEAQEK